MKLTGVRGQTTENNARYPNWTTISLRSVVTSYTSSSASFRTLFKSWPLPLCPRCGCLVRRQLFFATEVDLCSAYFRKPCRFAHGKMVSMAKFTTCAVTVKYMTCFRSRSGLITNPAFGNCSCFSFSAKGRAVKLKISRYGTIRFPNGT